MIFKKIKRSFKYALYGFSYFIKERNIKIHFSASLVVIFLGFYFNISLIEWALITFCIILVISLEILNTVIEDIMNLLHPEKNQKVMVVKDLAAASVFISALGSLIVGLIIFIPYILKKLQ